MLLCRPTLSNWPLTFIPPSYQGNQRARSIGYLLYYRWIESVLKLGFIGDPTQVLTPGAASKNLIESVVTAEKDQMPRNAPGRV